MELQRVKYFLTLSLIISYVSFLICACITLHHSIFYRIDNFLFLPLFILFILSLLSGLALLFSGLTSPKPIEKSLKGYNKLAVLGFCLSLLPILFVLFVIIIFNFNVNVVSDAMLLFIWHSFLIFTFISNILCILALLKDLKYEDKLTELAIFGVFLIILPTTLAIFLTVNPYAFSQ